MGRVYGPAGAWCWINQGHNPTALLFGCTVNPNPIPVGHKQWRLSYIAVLVPILFVSIIFIRIQILLRHHACPIAESSRNAAPMRDDPWRWTQPQQPHQSPTQLLGGDPSLDDSFDGPSADLTPLSGAGRSSFGRASMGSTGVGRASGGHHGGNQESLLHGSGFHGDAAQSKAAVMLLQVSTPPPAPTHL